MLLLARGLRYKHTETIILKGSQHRYTTSFHVRRRSDTTMEGVVEDTAEEEALAAFAFTNNAITTMDRAPTVVRPDHRILPCKKRKKYNHARAL